MLSRFAPPGCLYASLSAVKAALLERKLCGTPLCIMRSAHQDRIENGSAAAGTREATWNNMALPLLLSSSSSLPLFPFNMVTRQIWCSQDFFYFFFLILPLFHPGQLNLIQMNNVPCHFTFFQPFNDFSLAVQLLPSPKPERCTTKGWLTNILIQLPLGKLEWRRSLIVQSADLTLLQNCSVYFYRQREGGD